MYYLLILINVIFLLFIFGVLISPKSFLFFVNKNKRKRSPFIWVLIALYIGFVTIASPIIEKTPERIQEHVDEALAENEAIENERKADARIERHHRDSLQNEERRLQSVQESIRAIASNSRKLEGTWVASEFYYPGISSNTAHNRTQNVITLNSEIVFTALPEVQTVIYGEKKSANYRNSRIVSYNYKYTEYFVGGIADLRDFVGRHGNKNFSGNRKCYFSYVPNYKLTFFNSLDTVSTRLEFTTEWRSWDEIVLFARDSNEGGIILKRKK